MFYKIKRDDDIFESDLFSKDSMAFCIMNFIRADVKKYPEPKIFSNGKNCVIMNSDPEHSVIAWTADDFKEKGGLYEFIKKEFHTNKVFKIMAKKDFYDYLTETNIIPELHIQTLGVYSCQKLNDICYVGRPDHFKEEEIEQVAQMAVNFGKETGEDTDAQLTDYIEKAHEFLSDPMFYVWRDTEEKIVAIASLKIDENYSKIGRVYTNSQDRGKSYAKMLVHYLTSIVLKGGKKVMIFTDFDYPPSNKCYQSVGYELNCTIVNFTPPVK